MSAIKKLSNLVNVRGQRPSAARSLFAVISGLGQIAYVNPRNYRTMTTPIVLALLDRIDVNAALQTPVAMLEHLTALVDGFRAQPHHSRLLDRFLAEYDKAMTMATSAVRTKVMQILAEDVFLDARMGYGYTTDQCLAVHAELKKQRRAPELKPMSHINSLNARGEDKRVRSLATQALVASFFAPVDIGHVADVAEEASSRACMVSPAESKLPKRQHAILAEAEPANFAAEILAPVHDPYDGAVEPATDRFALLHSAAANKAAFAAVETPGAVRIVSAALELSRAAQVHGVRSNLAIDFAMQRGEDAPLQTPLVTCLTLYAIVNSYRAIEPRNEALRLAIDRFDAAMDQAAGEDMLNAMTLLARLVFGTNHLSGKIGDKAALKAHEADYFAQHKAQSGSITANELAKAAFYASAASRGYKSASWTIGQPGR